MSGDPDLDTMVDDQGSLTVFERRRKGRKGRRG
jgi:hypothetical protein